MPQLARWFSIFKTVFASFPRKRESIDLSPSIPLSYSERGKIISGGHPQSPGREVSLHSLFESLFLGMLILLTLIVLSTGCAHPGGSDRSIGSIARPFEFNQTKWETDALSHRLWESLKPASRDQIDDSEVVKEYFRALSSQGSDKADLENRAERILAKQIRGVLIDEGIFNPLDTFIPLKIVFPPVSFEFESPPSLLVVSPREEIKLLKRRTLEPGLSVAQKEEIESEVDGLGYSSLVVGLGGVGFTVPTMVYETTDIRHAIDIAVEEWFHQYMFFQPLGFNYALDSLGWRTNPDIATMNETVAGIVSKEIGEKVYSKYYAPVEEEPPPPAGPSEFSLLMREIRINVDRLLAEGKATQAEEYMRERRDFLASKGYYIRKLNQAYFAFHGTYADEPTTVSPIGKDLQKLRADSSSLGEFLNEVKTMTNYEDLKRAIQ